MAMLSDQEQVALLEQARRGDPEAINRLFSQERARLRRMVELRLDDRLRGRVDASDVIQEAQLAVFVRLPDFLARPSMPFWVWLRLEVGRHLVLVHRQHLGTAMRDVRREVPLHPGTMPPPSSTALAGELAARQSSPSQTLARAERIERIRQAISTLDLADREILTLRHFEMLNHRETAQVLGISEAAAAKRYIRALDRLETALAQLPGGLEGL
jgi:RNA polymerase sigma-70 factor (ECF subfamily)